MNFLRDIQLEELFKDFVGYINYTGPLSLIRTLLDIGIVSYVIYKIIVLVKETRAWQLIKGIIFIVIANELSRMLGLRTINYLLNSTINILAIALVVLFQPELRRVLEQIGRSRFKDFFNFDETNIKLQITTVIEEIVKACTELSKSFTGALIVIEKDTKIGEIINNGIQLDSNVNTELILNIFTPNTPLHDGALIIRDNRIKAAACFLPLTDNPNLSKELGTRHRAALGITEISDSIAVIVSEESGKISFALNGGLTRNLTPDLLRKALNKNLLENSATNKKLPWKVKPR